MRANKLATIILSGSAEIQTLVCMNSKPTFFLQCSAAFLGNKHLYSCFPMLYVQRKRRVQEEKTTAQF